VPLTLGTEPGVCHGTGYLTDGERTTIFEYPRHTPDGEQMDFVEVIQDDAYHK
jgi:hypothetical protein